MYLVWLFILMTLWNPKVFSCLKDPIQGNDLISGKPIALATRWKDSSKKGTVVVFLSATCPCSKSHEPVIEKLSKEFSEFQFLAVNSNQDEPEDLAKKHFTESGLTIPIIRDAQAQLANKLKALKTPHVFVIGPQGECWYDGGVDDTRKAEKASRHYLRDALTQLQKGKEPSEKVVRTLGCVIKRGG